MHKDIYIFYNDVEPVSQLVVQICDIKQSYTQYGGLRPYGVSFLIAGYDSKEGYQLYHTDPSGNYSGWFATAIGSNNLTASSILKQVKTYVYVSMCVCVNTTVSSYLHAYNSYYLRKKCQHKCTLFTLIIIFICLVK
uniref:Proteasome endopeptidase complex n=1 Tax=Piliocolobus tephrosceles TaxID=591936 RepID=A0A8C9LMY6_9PRIM